VIPMHHVSDEPLRLSDDETMALLEIAVTAWAAKVDTADIAKVATFRMGRVIPESAVANLLAAYWSEER
jgi:hypothetical protein